MPGIRSGPGGQLAHTNGISKLFMTAEETKEPEEAKVEGKIPSYIAGGKFLRVGPCKFDFPDFTVNHWLDGYALVSKFEIRNDSISFEKKYIQTDAYKKAMALQKPAISEFATRAQADAKKGFFARVISSLIPEFTDNAYSTLFQLGQDIFATCDTQFFHRIDPTRLNAECRCDTVKRFSVNGQCAHPLTDVNGDVYNVGFTIGATGLKYQIFKIPFGKTSEDMMKNAKVIATVSPRWTGSMGTSHSFGMTENYVVLIEQPYIVSSKNILASIVKGDTLIDWLEWRPEDKNKFIIIEKSTGKVIKTEFVSAAAFYFLHVVNCYEESNQLVLDIITYDSPKIIDNMFLANLRENNIDSNVDLPCIQRFVIPLIPDLKVANVRENLNLINNISTESTAVRNGSKIIVSGEKLTNGGLDLPTFNKRFLGRKYKYVYTSGAILPSEFSNCVCKVNLETKDISKWKFNDYTFPGEPYFVPDPKGAREDEGVLIVALTDTRQDHNDYVVFLDAQSLTEIARTEFKSHVPSSLHGIFLPN